MSEDVAVGLKQLMAIREEYRLAMVGRMSICLVQYGVKPTRTS